MSGILASAQTSDVDTGTAKRTILQITAASNHRVTVKEISVSFQGTVNASEPILVQTLRQSDAGTGGDSLTPKKMNEADDETLQTTALEQIDSSEPTGTDEVLGEMVHPQGGYTWQAPFGGEIVVKGGDRLGVAVTSDEDIKAKARMIFEE